MAISGISAAISGLQAAGTRLVGSANNIANAQSVGKALNQPLIPDPNAPADPGYQPVRTEQTPVLNGGGTRANFAPVRPAAVPVFNPDSIDANGEGIVSRPNVDLATEITEQILSVRTFQANLKTVQTSDEITKSLLDIKT